MYTRYQVVRHSRFEGFTEHVRHHNSQRLVLWKIEGNITYHTCQHSILRRRTGSFEQGSHTLRPYLSTHMCRVCHAGGRLCLADDPNQHGTLCDSATAHAHHVSEVGHSLSSERCRGDRTDFFQPLLAREESKAQLCQWWPRYPRQPSRRL